MEIIASIVVGVLSLAGTVTGSYFANKKSTALIAYRIDQLETKVDKHNHLIERMYKVEDRVNVLDVKQEETDRRIGKLEGGRA